jgi:hypothetical protein
MKTKDIAIAVTGLVVLALCSYFVYTSLFPSSSGAPAAVNTVAQKDTDNFQYVKDPDNELYNEIKKLSDYGSPALENIGKPDPFIY